MTVSDQADDGAGPDDAGGDGDPGEPGVSGASRTFRLPRVRRAPGPPADPAGPSGRRLLELLGEINHLEARFAAELAEFDTSGEWRLDGAASVQGWLRHHGRMTGPAASSRVKAARRLPELPTTAEAFAAGEISRDHVNVIVAGTELTEGLDGTTTVDADAVADAVAAGERIFADAARQMDPANLREATVHFRHAVEPQIVVSDEIDAVSRRHLHMSQSLDGRYHLRGEFDAEGGAIIRTALDSLMPAVADTHDTPRRDRFHTPPRSTSRRLADALVATCWKALDSGRLPATGGERPHLSVIVDLETLQRRAGVPAAELENGVALSGEAARRLACDAGVTRIITDGASQPLDIGRKTATVPTHIRRALVVRDGGCAWPGCDRPPGWCDAHHIVHWANGGTTSAQNCVLLCRTHHSRVHEHRWTVTLTAHGQLEVKPP